jgi:FAD/FMN-containing dehydrogenase
VTGVGLIAHDQAVARLRASYDAVPAGLAVRLSKKTSNLFRVRGRSHAPGLDASGLGGVISVDTAARTADVQGMCTYADLVEATLAAGLMPLVVPQLRTITLGGAVAGLGIESTSFRNGLPHESVTEMDVLTGTGEIVTTVPGEALFDTFPNSYGSLGYATRLRIELEPAPACARLRHIRFSDFGLMAKTIAQITETRTWRDDRVDGLDGVVFEPGEAYLTVARWEDHDQPEAASDYTRQAIYYQSLRQRETDRLSMHDYLWRWDTDWFWCSRAFGVQNPRLRRLWPRRWRRSDFYHKLVGIDQRFGIAKRLDRRAGRPEAERVVQDVEIPVERLAEFLEWFDDKIGMRPVWICPLRLRGDRGWPSYPLAARATYVNAGFWGTVPVGPGAKDAPLNRAIEERVHALGGHKSLYSEAFYDKETFDQLYAGANLAAVKRRYDPADRFTSLYDKAVRQL